MLIDVEHTLNWNKIKQYEVRFSKKDNFYTNVWKLKNICLRNIDLMELFI